MTKFVKWLFISFAFLLSPFFSRGALANTTTAASCSVSDVKAAINSANDGDTVVIPNGSCSWSSGIVTSKQITLRGQSVGGVTITDNNPNGCNSCTPASFLLNFTIGGSFHTTLANIHFTHGTGVGSYVIFQGTGLVPLMHDVVFDTSESMFDSIQWDVTGGVIWNTTFNGTLDSNGLSSNGCLVVKPNIPWDSPSTMGTADTTGTNNLYIEDSTFNLVDGCPDVDDNGRVVMRHIVCNGCAGLTHGVTSSQGGRFVEIYDSTFLNPTTTPARNLNRYFWWRAGTGVVTGNSIQWINSQSYPNKPTWAFSAENAQRAADKGCCVGWMCRHQPGSGSDGVTHSPSKTPPTINSLNGTPVPAGNDPRQISEPLYFWNNTGTGDGVAHLGFVDGAPVVQSDFCNTSVVPVNPATGKQWSTADLVVVGRDIFMDGSGNPNAGAKPGWARYPYPHPLRSGSSGPAPAPPTNPAAVVH